MNNLAFLNELSLKDIDSFGKGICFLGEIKNLGADVAGGFAIPHSSFLKFKQNSNTIDLEEELAVRAHYREISTSHPILVDVHLPCTGQKMLSVKGEDDLLDAISHLWSKARRDNSNCAILVTQSIFPQSRGLFYTTDPTTKTSDTALVKVYTGSGVFDHHAIRDNQDSPFKDLYSSFKPLEEAFKKPLEIGWALYRGKFYIEHADVVDLKEKAAKTASKVWVVANKKPLGDISAADSVVTQTLGVLELAPKIRNVSFVLSLDEQLDTRLLDKAKELRFKEHAKNIQFLLPPVRSSEALKEIKRILSSLGFRRGSNFKFFLSLKFPANVFLLEDLLEVGVDGVVVDHSELFARMLGVKTSAYSQDLIFVVLDAIAKVCKEQNIPVYYTLGSYDPDFVDRLVSVGVGGFVVEQDIVDEIYGQVREAEKRVVSVSRFM